MTVGFGSSSTAELEDHLGIPGVIPPKKVSFRSSSTRSMSIRSASNSGHAPLALFLNCQELTFVATDISTYKQFITILNPYDFDIRFQTFCTNPNRYKLSKSNGTVPAMTSLDLTVRLKDPSDANSVDGFRFVISELSNPNTLGERELRLILLAENPAPSEKLKRENFRPQKASSIRRAVDVEENHDAEPKPNFFVIVIGMTCLLGLCLPTSGDSSESWVAQYITLTVNQKLIAAFVLGMVTMVVFRTR